MSMQKKWAMMTGPTNKISLLSEAVRILARRSLSRKELQTKLTRKGWKRENIGSVLNRLTEMGYLNDQNLSQHLFDYYSESGYYGLKAIFHKIRLRGLPTDCLTEQVISWNENDQEYFRAQEYIKRKYHNDHTESDIEKVARSLLSRGFSRETIARIISEIG